jgi:hypothetical protein
MTYRRDWSTVMEIDFTQQPNQTFATDGNYTVGGFTWVKHNSTNDAVAASIINGTGLNFQPGTNADYNGNIHDLPYLWLSCANIFANYGNKFGWNTALRLFVSIGSDNLTADFDCEVFGFDNNGAALEGVVNRGYILPASTTTGTATSVAITPNTSLGTASFQEDVFTLGNGNKTLCLEISSVQLHKINLYRTASLAVNTPFPPLSTFLPEQVTFMGGTSVASTVNLGLIVGAGTGITSFYPQLMGIILGAKRAQSGTSLSIFFQRVRLDACFGGYDDIS